MRKSIYPVDCKEIEEHKDVGEFNFFPDEEEEEISEDIDDAFPLSEKELEVFETESDSTLPRSNPTTDHDSIWQETSGITIKEVKKLCVRCRRPLTLQQQQATCNMKYMRCIHCGFPIKHSVSQKCKNTSVFSQDFSSMTGGR